MATYNLRFKKQGEQGYWHTSIYGETIEDAIENSRELISSRPYKIEKAYLEEIIYKTKKIWEWESE